MPSPADLEARIAATLAAIPDADADAEPRAAESLPIGRLLDGGLLDLAGVDPPTLRALLEALTGAPPRPALRGLLLDRCGLTDAADAERVATCLYTHTSIERLDLSGSGLADDALAPALAALRERPLRTLALDELARSPELRRRLAADLADGALSVEHLSLRTAHGQAMRESEFTAWLAALAAPTALRSLDLRGRELPQGAGGRLVEVLADNHRLIYLGADLHVDDAARHAGTLAAYLARNHNRAPRGASRPRHPERLRAAAASPSPAPPGLPGALPRDLDPDDLDAFLRVADALARRPGELTDTDDPRLAAARSRLLTLQRALRREVRRGARAKRRQASRAEARERDRVALARVGIRRSRGANRAPPPPADPPVQEDIHTLHSPQRCYVCKAPYRELHPFYDRLCLSCGERSYARRGAAVDLRGRVAVVTGGRIKIGHAIARRLLAWGARVVVTTRFPSDAARRFAAAPDFADFADRLEIYGLDLRDLPALEGFCAGLLAKHPRVDALINNAAQTIRRPPAFYAELFALEEAGLGALPAKARALLPPPLVDRRGAHMGAGGLALSEASSLFPAGTDDGFGQPEDHRPTNSWRLRLDEVSTIEMVEAQLVGAIAPFVLSARLRRAMARPEATDDGAFIVQVAAPEGQFYRHYKAPFHPHTNMAKAALNMLTRTSAEDYAGDRIFMTSVDTGWASNENPRPIAEAMRERGFTPPLDMIDAATRVCDPLVRGLVDGDFLFGVLLKDFRPIPW